MKIACVTDDGQTICAHFGRAGYYLVATVEDGQVVEKEMREKFGHRHVMAQPQEAGEHTHQHAEGAHGTDPAAQDRHRRMAESISDCQVLIAGGMGAGAFASMQAAGIEVVVSDIEDIDLAVQAYLDGKLSHQDRLVH
jgi:predicted Fe-Mo cluster-binding NifX family protein